MSSSVPSKTSATVSSKMTDNISVNSSANTRRVTLNKAAREHLKRKERSARPKTFSNSKPQTLTGLLGLSTCNSGFLNSLLADVAKAKQDILRAKEEDLSSSPPSVKRRRISMQNSADVTGSPRRQTNRPLLNDTSGPTNFLDLLWEESWIKPPVMPRLHPRAAAIIPATVSETFPQEPQAKVESGPTQMETEDGFGWYIDMDEDEDWTTSDDSHCYSPYASKGSTDNLAFKASTAPKATNHDAEVEWAKAADTVDDVLGELF